MKKIAYIIVFIGLAIGLVSCHKPIGSDSPPPSIPLNFVLIGKDGKGLVHSVKDSVSLGYVLNGVTQTFHLTTYKVQLSPTDTTKVTSYGGFAILDLNTYSHSFIADVSGRGTRTFTLYLNGVSVGNIYMDYLGYMALSSPRPLSSLFTFNGESIAVIGLVGVFSDGNHVAFGNNYPNVTNVYVLQL